MGDANAMGCLVWGIFLEGDGGLLNVFRPFGAYIFLETGLVPGAAPRASMLRPFGAQIFWGWALGPGAAPRAMIFRPFGATAPGRATSHPETAIPPPKSIAHPQRPPPRRGTGCQPRAKPWDGYGTGSIFTNFKAPKGRKMSAQGVALGRRGAIPPWAMPTRWGISYGVFFLKGTGVSSMCFAPSGLQFSCKRASYPGLRPGFRCYAPSGLEFLGDGRPNPGRGPRLRCLAPLGRRPRGAPHPTPTRQSHRPNPSPTPNGHRPGRKPSCTAAEGHLGVRCAHPNLQRSAEVRVRTSAGFGTRGCFLHAGQTARVL